MLIYLICEHSSRRFAPRGHYESMHIILLRCYISLLAAINTIEVLYYFQMNKYSSEYMKIKSILDSLHINVNEYV